MQYIYCIAACIDILSGMRYPNAMDDHIIKKTLMSLSTRLVTTHNSNSHKNIGDSVLTHDLHRDDLGLWIMRLVKGGFVNEECIIMSHACWMAAIERKWPIWSEKDPSKRMFGNVHFYVSGDMHRVKESLLFADLTGTTP